MAVEREIVTAQAFRALVREQAEKLGVVPEKIGDLCGWCDHRDELVLLWLIGVSFADFLGEIVRANPSLCVTRFKSPKFPEIRWPEKFAAVRTPDGTLSRTWLPGLRPLPPAAKAPAMQPKR
ncbi:MAG: hypothetical protein ABSE73_12775 [Planctomycetota bacterium]